MLKQSIQSQFRRFKVAVHQHESITSHLVFISQFTSKKWPFLMVGFYSANQITLKSFEKALIG